MQKLFLILCFSAATTAVSAQAKRYVLLEHFTNSLCSICKSKSPAFFSVVDQYAADVHHISYHPSFPYPDCIFYQANKSENTTRTDLYNIPGTPRVALNGTLAAAASQLLPASVLQAQLGQTSPLLLTVNETTNGSQRSVHIQARSMGAVPAGTYKLYAAVVEKKVNYTSPIGYATHRNVFRKMLPTIEGEPFSAAPAGESVNFTYSYTLNPAWVADSIYVVAFVQNTASKEVLNSGTKYDPIVLDAGEVPAPERLDVYPNPATDEARLALPGQTATRVEVFSIEGRRVYTTAEPAQELVRLPLEGLNKGVYVVKITAEGRVRVGKFVKQ